jgi:homoserine dehydrogenase
MKLEGSDFEPTLAEAQKLGYAEADPSLDVDGFDSEHKIGILASLAHGFWVNPKQIYVEGIRSITRTDIEFAGKLGYTIKLLGVVKVIPSPEPKKNKGAPRKAVQVSVYPALIPNTHVLASVNHVFNAVFVRGDVVGDTLFYGRGAGKDATASAILSDVADAALDLKHRARTRVPPFVPHDRSGAVLPIEQVISRAYLRFSVVDKPGTLARIAAVLAKCKIGISSVIQPEGHEGKSVPLILMTHDAPNAAMKKALATIAKLPVIKAPPVMLRVETFE